MLFLRKQDFIIMQLERIIKRYRELGIENQIDYSKFYLYSLITHSTAIEGSTITELENQIMFDDGVSLAGKSIEEQNMNLDLKVAYEKSFDLIKNKTPLTIDILIMLSALVMKNTGQEYKTILGDFSSSKGELRLLNVTAGIGGKSYMNFSKVPAKLEEFCKQINIERQNFSTKSIEELYQISFDAHYNLVTIHPWADGNGRMARLMMNMLQFEFGLIPTKILKEDKEDYIKALVATRETEDLDIFRKFMTDIMVKNLDKEIENYLDSIGETVNIQKVQTKEKIKSRDIIITLLRKDGTLNTASLASQIGITTKAVEKHLSKLKSEGIIERIGSNKTGYWKVNKL